MAFFPLFIDLENKKCVVVGGGRVATRKAETLLQFAARIVVISPEITEQLEGYKEKGSLVHVQRKYTEVDIEGAFLIIAATSDRVVNEKIVEAAIKRNIFVNVADNPEKCTFIFPSVIKRDELVIGVSTSGSYPVLSKRIRKKIDEMLRSNFPGSITELLRNCRERALLHINDEEKRKELMNRVLDEIIFDSKIMDSAGLNEKIEKLFSEYLI
jgi:precorrin-2 dehydrogenase / sirohydrochlorin ferrochelatase